MDRKAIEADGHCESAQPASRDSAIRFRLPRGPFARTLAAGGLALAGLAGSAVAFAAADTSPPPTPTVISVVSSGADGGGAETDISLDGESDLGAHVSSSRNATVTSTARSGAGGVAIASQSAPGYVRWGIERVPQGRQHAAIRTWVRVDSRGAGESVDLFTVSNSQNVRNFDFFVTGDTQRFKWDIHYSSNDESSFRVEYGRWYLVEVLLDFEGSEHTARVRIDGIDQGTIRSAGVDSAVRTVKLGSYTAKTHRQHYDDIAVDVAHGPASWVEPDGGGPRSTTVTWEAVEDQGGAGLHGYHVWRSGSWYGFVGPNSTSFVDAAPRDGATYQLRAEDRAGNRSGWSAPIGVGDDPGGPVEPPPDTTPPPTPEGLSVEAQPGRSVVTWDPVVDAGGSGLHGTHIWRNGLWYGFAPPGTSSFVDTEPVACAAYSVRAEDKAGNKSDWSDPVGC